MHPAIFTTVIFPTLRVRGACVVMITTPGAETGIFRHLINCRDPKTHEFLVRRVVKQLVCEVCRAAARADGIDETKQAVCCTHRIQWMPWWFSRAAQSSLNVVYSIDAQRGAAELSGEQQFTSSPMFHPDMVALLPSRVMPWRELCDAPEQHIVGRGHRDSPRPIDLVLAFDPAGGGPGSNTALVTFALVRDHSENSLTTRLVVRHRRRPRAPGATRCARARSPPPRARGPATRPRTSAAPSQRTRGSCSRRRAR